PVALRRVPPTRRRRAGHVGVCRRLAIPLRHPAPFDGSPGVPRLNSKTVLTFGIFAGMALGLALAGWLFVVNNAGAVLRAFAAVGWGLAAVVFIRASIVALNGTAW